MISLKLGSGATDSSAVDDKMADRAGTLPLLDEKFYKTFYQKLPLGIAHFDLQGNWIKVNQRFADIIGYSIEEATRLHYDDVTLPEERAESAEFTLKLMAGEIDAISRERRMLRKDGTTIWIRLTATLVRNDAGQAEYGVGIFEDIHAQKEAEQEKQALFELAEQRSAELKAVIEHLPDAVYFGNENGIFMCNDNGLKILGAASLQDLQDRIGELGKKFAVRSPTTGELIQSEQLAFNRALRGEVAVSEVVATRADTGEDVRIRDTAAPVIRDGKIIGAVAVNTDITEQIRMQEALQRQTNTLQMVLDSMADGVTVCDQDGVVFLTNRAAEEILHLDHSPIPISNLSEHFVWYRPDGVTPYPHELRPLVRALKGHAVNNSEGVIRNRDRADALHISANARPIRNEAGQVIGAVNVFRDISESKRAQAELRQAEEHFRLLIEGTTDYAIFMLDAYGHIASWNPGAERILGYSEDEVIDEHFSIFYTPEAIETGAPERALSQAIREGRAEADGWRLRKDGEQLWVTGVLDAVHDESGQVKGFVKILRDNTERRLAEERSWYLAHHDPLTGLANRAYFNERLQVALATADADSGQVALLLLDLDRFKLINDTLGHHVGDLLLKEVANRLLACVRPADTVARLGGDEFVIIYSSLGHREHAEALAGRIVNELCRVYQLDGHEVRSGTSVGVTIYPNDATTAGDLLKHADLAMYRAKSSGRNNYQVYTNSLAIEVQTRREREDHLRRAVEQGEFELYYQPQVDLVTRRISGVEVLLRCNNAQLHGLPTSELISIAEETGVIIALGEWVLRTACQQGRKWQEIGLLPFRMAVNFSPRQFQAPNFMDTLKRVLAETGFDPNYLEVEITEGLLMKASGANADILATLKEIGAHISIDDFGTGFSALSYLKHFPIDVLKLDQSLIQHLPHDHEDSAIVSAVIGLAQSLNLRVVAEGVETLEQLEFLKARGCEIGQGFIFSPPVSANEMERLLLEDKDQNV